MKRLMIIFFTLFIMIAFIACSRTTSPDNTQKPDAKAIMNEFDTLTSLADVKLDEATSFIEENIASVSAEDASKMILRFEELQYDHRTALEDGFYTEDVQLKFQQEVEAGTDVNVPGNIKDSSLKELVQKARNTGFKVEQVEGAFIPVMDYSFYKKFSSFGTPDIKEYIELMSVESDQPSVLGGGVVIGWDEVIRRGVSHERFLEAYEDSHKRDAINALFSNYKELAFFGTEVTPLFDSQTGELLEDVRYAYEQAIADEGTSDFVKNLKAFMKIVAENNYRLTDEAENFRKSY